MTANRELTVAVVAGEASGDNLGAPLLRELRRRYPDARFVGIGGPGMIAEGLESWFDLEELNVNGFVDPIKRLPQLINILLTLRRNVLALKPDCFIGIDFNFFNLLLEGTLKRNGIRTVHYVSPTVWAWRRWRIGSIKRTVDLMLCLYPFETKIYQEHGIGVRYVGHPRALEIGPHTGASGKIAARQALGLPEAVPVVAILPGSRGGEVGYSGPDFFAAAEQIKTAIPDCHFVVPAANARRLDQIQTLLAQSEGLDAHLLDGQSREALTAADVVLVNSGTATLEAMLLKKPMVMSYRLGGMTYALIAQLVRTDFFALPNILAGEALVPELIQHEATPEALADEVLRLLNETDHSELLRRFDEIHQQLATDSACLASDAILELCGRGGDVLA